MSPSRELFTRIAGCYDALNRVLTCGVDVLWRRRALAQLARLAGNPQAVLDLATGTADLACGLGKTFPAARVTGLDLTPAMLEIGRAKVARAKLGGRVSLVEGNAEALDFPDASFDVVTCSFGFRNFPHKDRALAEAYRVLKPRGKMMILEFFRMESRVFSVFTSWWLGLWTRLLAHRLKADYAYLRQSIAHTTSAAEFTTLAEAAGFGKTKEMFYIPSCHCLYFQKYDRI